MRRTHRMPGGALSPTTLTLLNVLPAIGFFAAGSVIGVWAIVTGARGDRPFSVFMGLVAAIGGAYLSIGASRRFLQLRRDLTTADVNDDAGEIG